MNNNLDTHTPLPPHTSAHPQSTYLHSNPHRFFLLPPSSYSQNICISYTQPATQPITEMLITSTTCTGSFFLIYNGQITFHDQSLIFLIKIHLFTNVSNATLHGTNLATPHSNSQPAKLTYATFHLQSYRQRLLQIFRHKCAPYTSLRQNGRFWIVTLQ